MSGRPALPDMLFNPDQQFLATLISIKPTRAITNEEET
jgi:hypothetical protein